MHEACYRLAYSSKILTAGLVATAVWAAFPAMAAVPLAQAAASASTARDRSAYEALADVVLDEASFAKRSEASLSSIMQSFAADDDFAEMEQAYPGLVSAITQAIAPVVRNEATLILPLYRQDLVELYAAHFSEEEAVTAREMLSSPAMIQFRNATIAAQSLTATTRDIVSGNTISSESIKRDMSTAALQATLQMNGADIKAIKDYYATSAGQKFLSLNPHKLAIDSKWSNYISPGAEAKIADLVIEAMSGHIARSDPQMAKILRKEMRKEMRKEFKGT